MENSMETNISKAKRLEEIGEFWDNHSLGDYWDKTKKVEFSVRAKKRHRITIEPELYDKIVNRHHFKGFGGGDQDFARVF